MRDSLRTNISQYSSAGGRQLARAANVRVVEPAADLPGAERGNLYMLIEVTGSEGGHPTLYRNILNAAQKAFYETEGSLTTALQRAVRSAHSELRKTNETLKADWRAGISCAALQGMDLTIAQVNPALVLVSHPRTVDQFPPEVEPDSRPLGGEDRPDIQLIHTQVEPGTLILLADSRWLEHVQPQALAVAVALDSPNQAVDYLGQLGVEADLNALVIGIGQDEPEQAGDAAAAALQAPDAAVAPIEPEPPAAPPARPAQGGGLLGRLRRPAAAAPEQKAPERAAQQRAVPAAQAPAPVQAPVQAPAAVRAAPVREALPPAEPFAPLPAELLAEPAVAEDEPAEVEEEVVYEERPKRSPWPLILALVVIPLVIAAIVFSMWWLRTQNQEKQFQEALTGASAAVTSAQGLPDESAARQRLSTAKDFLDKARAIKPDDSRLQPVQASYDENLDRVNHVTPLYGVVPLWDFGAKASLKRVLVKGNAAYALDGGQQQISRLILSALGDSAKPADPPVALQKAQQVKDSDQVVGDLVDMAWVDAVSNQRSRLLAIDSSKNLYSYDVTFGAARQALGGDQGTSGSPQLMASYSGNLYLVDTKANQIWRYKPTDKGYENAPEPYFADNVPVNLTGVQSIAIDGSIWVLYADGRLLKFFTGKQDAFTPSGLPTPLSGPTAVAVSADGDQIYIADTGNGRIVELSKKTGQFQRQFRPAESGILRDMRDLYLDEAAGVFYIATGSKVYKANLPRPGTTPGATQPAAAQPTAAQPAATATPQK